MRNKLSITIVALAMLALPTAASAHRHHAHPARHRHHACRTVGHVVRCFVPPVASTVSAPASATAPAAVEQPTDVGVEPSQEEIVLLDEACANTSALTPTEAEECAVVHSFDVAQEEMERDYPG